jgi:hypothetical protein
MPESHTSLVVYKWKTLLFFVGSLHGCSRNSLLDWRGRFITWKNIACCVETWRTSWRRRRYMVHCASATIHCCPGSLQKKKRNCIKWEMWWYIALSMQKKHTEKEKLKKKSLAAPPSLIPKRGHPHHHITLNCMWWYSIYYYSYSEKRIY